MSSLRGTPSEDATSKFPKKLSRDIYLSNDIGRDPNVDPFVSRDITKIFGDARKLERGTTTLSYAEKPKLRHSPSPVSMLKSTGRGAAAVGSRSGTPCEGSYTPQLQESQNTITFPKDVRWGEDRAQSAAMQRKEVVSRQRAMELDVALQRARVDLNPPPLIIVPDARNAPHIGKYSGRRGDKTVNERQLAAPIERFTVMPWDASRSKLAKKSVHLQLPPTVPTTANAAGNSSSRPPPLAHGGGGAFTGRPGGKPMLSTQRSMATSESMEEEEERWKTERTLLIQRMGLGGAGANGANRNGRKKKEPTPKGADFSSLASRSAPMWNQPRAQEIHDLMYSPSTTVTSNARAHSANVRIGNYSSRNKAATNKPFVDVADKILQFENLLKFHDRQKLNAQRSVFALPQEFSDGDDDLGDDSAAAEGGITGGSSSPNKRTKSHKCGDDDEPMLSRIDDVALHPESTRPPQRGLFSPQVASSPSLFLFADRSDTTISHVLGGARQVSSASNRSKLRHNTDGGASSLSAYKSNGGGSSPSVA
jgi:hypothetical protein